MQLLMQIQLDGGSTKTNAKSCPIKTWFCGSHSCCLKQLPQTILSKAIVHGSPCDSMDHLDLKPVRMFGSMRCIRCWNSLCHWFSTEATALAIGQTLAAVECFGWKPNEIQPLTVNRPDVGIAGWCPHFYDEPLAALRIFSCDSGASLILSAFLLSLKEREWPWYLTTCRYMVADDNIFRSYLTNEYKNGANLWTFRETAPVSGEDVLSS